MCCADSGMITVYPNLGRRDKFLDEELKGGI